VLRIENPSLKSRPIYNKTQSRGFVRQPLYQVIPVEQKFKALGNDVRLRIYRALREETLCVCEINELLDMSQSAVSQHLSRLEQAGLVESTRVGQWTFYQPVQDSFQDAIDGLFKQAPEPMLNQLRSIKSMNLCDLRDTDGNLSLKD